MITANKTCASFVSGEEIFAAESKFLNVLSTVASYVKSKCRAVKLKQLFTSVSVKVMDI